MHRVYLDANATTPLCEEARLAMQDAMQVSWANPSSIHEDGRRARKVVEDARETVAALMKTDPRDVLFTSGGTEANNIAIRSLVGGRRTLITSRLEHPSIVRVAEELERSGRKVFWANVLPCGEIDVGHVLEKLRAHPDSALALQAVNSETGVVQPLAEIARVAGELGAELHVDAVQAWGRVAMDLAFATTSSLAAHKFGGPKGIGVLAKTPCTTLSSLLFGGAQERGVRPGTLDPIMAAGLGAAVRHALSQWEAGERERIGRLRDRLEQDLVAAFPDAIVNGIDAKVRASHVSNISFGREQGPELVAALDLEGVSVSSGSACSAGTTDPSPVITAMAGRERSRSAVRFSLGEWVREEDIDFAIRACRRVLARIRAT